MSQQTTAAPVTKTGIRLPEGSVSPSNFVGDPNGGKFIDWSSEFMQKGLSAPAEANEYGTPSVYMGKATGFGKLPNAPLMPPEMSAAYDSREPDGSGTGTGQPYYPGITGESPYDGSHAAQPPTSAPQARGVPAPAGIPPAMMGDGRAMPFAAQLAPMMAAMRGQAPAQQRPQAPPAAPAPPVRAAPPPAKPSSPMHAGMDGWIDWEGQLVALMGGPPAGDDEADAAPPALAAPPAKPQQAKTRPGSGHGGRGTERQAFTYGEDDVGSSAPAQKSLDTIEALDALLKGLTPVFAGEAFAKSGGGGHKYLTRRRGPTGWIYSYSDKGEKVHPPTKLESADHHVAHALHQIGPEHGQHMEVHVTDPSGDHREAQEVGVHVGGTHQETHTHTKKWGPVAHTLAPHRPDGPGRKAHAAFARAWKGSAAKHGKTIAEHPAAPKIRALEATGEEPRRPAPPKPPIVSKQESARAAMPPLKLTSPAAPAQKPAAPKKKQEGPSQQAFNFTEKSMSTDIYGRALSKGLYAFKNEQRAASIPDEYLYDYLCAFVEEAYEHEAREPAHAQLNAKDQLAQMARAVMNELVQTIPGNPNLMRATTKYKVTTDMIASLLVAKGIYKPRSDAEFTDDGNAAMGAHLLGEAMAFSLPPSPWLKAEPAPRVGRQLVQHGPEDVSGLVKGGHVDPAELIATRETARVRALWAGAAPEVAQAAPSCPVHGGREIHKAMNLWNPMLPCTCSGTPNAHG